jgi:hypothetical protein
MNDVSWLVLGRAPWFLLLALSSTPSLAQGQLWVVDDDGGASVDFTAVQPAIDAASDGDTILIRAGVYGDATIDAKSLVMTGEATALGRDLDTITVRNLAPSQSVGLRYLRADHWMEFTGNQVPVYVEEVRVTFGSFVTYDRPGLTVTDCSDVTLVRCKLEGPWVQNNLFWPAREGLHAVRSKVYAYDSEVLGTQVIAGSNPFVDCSAPGLWLEDGTLFTSGCTITGGVGANTQSCSPCDGSPGLLLYSLDPQANPQAWTFDTSLAGGQGGFDTSCGVPGADGPPSEVFLGTLTALNGDARHYQIGSPLAGSDPAQVSYTGVAGDYVFGAYSLRQDPILFLGFAGILLPDLPVTLLLHGYTDAQGALQAAIPTPPIPAGYALDVYLQAGVIAADSTLWIASPSLLTLVP